MTSAASLPLPAPAIPAPPRPADTAPAVAPSTAAPSGLPSPLEPAPTADPPIRWGLARSVGGIAGLGLVGGIAGQIEALASAPAGLLTGAGVLMLTTPALVVGHQYLRLDASPAQLVAALWDGFTRAGLVALGLVPAVFWIGATSDRGPIVAFLGLLGVGALGMLFAIRNLARAEERAGGSFATGSGLAVIWAGLATLVGLRLLFLFSV